MPNEQMEAASSVQHKDKMADGSDFWSPRSCVAVNLLIFLEIMVGEQKQYSCVKLLDPCYRLKNGKNRSRS